MREDFEIKKWVERIRNGEASEFVTPNIAKKITCKLKKDEYDIFVPYPDSDKVILYNGIFPDVRLLEIFCYSPLTHSMIMGSLFGLNIRNEVIGDIIIDDDRYYFYTLGKICDFIKDNLLFVGKFPVTVREVELERMSSYCRKYEEMELVVSSLRIDNVVSKIVATNRDKVKIMIRDKMIFLNYNFVSTGSYVLKNGDVFSIRRFGKYKFLEIVKRTKKDNYIVKLLKYL